jgi:carbonic anhydrase
MDSEPIRRIRALQNQITLPDDTPPPEHRPVMLLMGCIDARLNIKDIGLKDGEALIHRNIAALVAGTKGEHDPEHVSEAAVLEFAIDVMKVKEIVVMGHTDCGGINACLHGTAKEHIRQYLSPLNESRDEVKQRGGDITKQARAMEEAAVRQSVTNLMSYDVVKRAVSEGRLKLHGWVINTGTGRISEMDMATGRFSPMAEPRTRRI